MDARRFGRSDRAVRTAREGKRLLALCLGPEGMPRLGWAIRLSRPSPGLFFARPVARGTRGSRACRTAQRHPVCAKDLQSVVVGGPVTKGGCLVPLSAGNHIALGRYDPPLCFLCFLLFILNRRERRQQRV